MRVSISHPHRALDTRSEPGGCKLILKAGTYPPAASDNVIMTNNNMSKDQEIHDVNIRVIIVKSVELQG